MADEWIRHSLGDIAQLVNGGTPSTKEPNYWGGDVHWVTTSELTRCDGGSISKSERRLSQAGLDNGPVKLVPSGSTLVGTTATVGTIAITTRSLAFNQQITGLIPDATKVLNGFLFLTMQNERETLQGLSAGTSFKRISTQHLRNLEVNVPPLPVQRRIVDLMTHLDNHIANLRLERDAGRVVRMTMLGSLLDGTLVIPECYDGVFMGKEAMQHLLNRDDWVDTTLGAIADWRGGMTPSMSNPAYWNDGDIPWISSKEVVGGVIVATEKMITTLAINETSLRLLPPGVVVVVVRSGILLHTFPVAYVPFESTVNQDVKSAVPFDCVDGRFLAHLIESNAQEILQRYRKTGTTVQSVDVPGLMSYRVSLPTLPVQRQIVDLMTHLDTYLSDLDFEVSNLEGVRQQVLASLLSGAIEVPDSYESLLSEAS